MKNRLLHAFTTEVRFIFRTPALLLLAVVAPLGYPFLYSYLYVNKFETEVPAVVVDLDRSAASRTFIRTLDATENISITGTLTDPAEGKTAVESGRATGCIIIPEDFATDLDRNARPALRIFIDATRFMPVSDMAKSLTDAVSATSRNIILGMFEKKGVPREVRQRYADAVSVETTVLANSAGTYGDFIIPAVLLLILQQTLFAATALSAAATRRKQTALRGITGTIGKSFPYFILYSLYAVLFFTWHYHLWKIPFSGAAVTLVPIVAVHLLTTILLGFFTGSLFRSAVTAMIVCLFTTYPLFLASGFAWPVTSMPAMMQTVSRLLPSTHFISAVFAAARLGAHWNNLQGDVAALLIALGCSILLITLRRLTETAAIRKQSV